jgi:hypothetical protein
VIGSDENGRYSQSAELFERAWVTPHPRAAGSRGIRTVADVKVEDDRLGRKPIEVRRHDPLVAVGTEPPGGTTAQNQDDG